MKILSNRARIILICAVFNLLFEFSGRGISELIEKPVLFLFLFGIYIAYFAVLEDLIVRFKLSNYQILLVAFLFGIIPEAFLTGNLFNPEIYWGGIGFFGVNWVTVIVINIFAWGIMQSIVAMYLANRISPRDWSHPRMGLFGWVLSMVYMIVVVILAQGNQVTPRGDAVGFIIAGGLALVALSFLLISLKKHKPVIPEFRILPIMDFFAFGSVALFVVLGTFIAGGVSIVTSRPLNKMAIVVEHLWLFFVGGAFIWYRLRKRSDVVV